MKNQLSQVSSDLCVCICDVCCRYGRDNQHLVKPVWWVRWREESRHEEIGRESRHSDSSWWWWWCLERESEQERREKVSNDETATCSSDVAFIIDYLHNDPIILLQLLILWTLSNLSHLLLERKPHPLIKTPRTLAIYQLCITPVHTCCSTGWV